MVKRRTPDPRQSKMFEDDSLESESTNETERAPVDDASHRATWLRVMRTQTHTAMMRAVSRWDERDQRIWRERYDVHMADTDGWVTEHDAQVAAYLDCVAIFLDLDTAEADWWFNGKRWRFR